MPVSQTVDCSFTGLEILLAIFKMLQQTNLVLPAQKHENRVVATAWTPEGLTLAVALADNKIYTFQGGVMTSHICVEYSNCEMSENNYLIRGIAFSPDSTKLAVAYGCAVYVYKIENDWIPGALRDNEFPQNSSVTCLVWLSSGTIVFGLQNGKVRALQMETEMVWTLYSIDSSTIALAVNNMGTEILSSHEAGSVFHYNFTNHSANRILIDLAIPRILGWAQECILVGGHDHQIVIYDVNGKLLKTFDYRQELPDEDILSSACCSSAGQNIAVALCGKVHLFTWSDEHNTWEEIDSSATSCFETVTSLALRHDGMKLAVGDLYSAVAEFKVIPRSANVDHRIPHVETNRVTIALSTDKYSSPVGILIRNVDTNLVSEISLENENGMPGSTIWPSFKSKKTLEKPLNNRVKVENLLIESELTTESTSSSMSSMVIVEPKPKTDIVSNRSMCNEKDMEQARTIKKEIPKIFINQKKKNTVLEKLLFSENHNNESDYISLDIASSSDKSSFTMDFGSIISYEESEDEIDPTMSDSAIASRIIRDTGRRKTNVCRSNSSELYSSTTPRPLLASGMLFQNLNDIPYDPIVDPPCWKTKTESIGRSCSDTDRIFCRNCGRLEVSMKDCPRCRDAYHVLTRQIDDEKLKCSSSTLITSPIRFTRQYTPEELRADFTLQLALLASLPPGLQRILEQQMLSTKRDQSCP